MTENQKNTIGHLMNELKVSITEIQIVASFYGLSLTKNQPHLQLSLQDANNTETITKSSMISFKKQKRSSLKKNAKFLDNEEIPEEFQVDHNESIEILKVIQIENRLANRKPRQFELNGETIRSIFFDDEAFLICGGLKDSKMRNLANKFNYGTYNFFDKFEAHRTSMAALKKYGSSILSFCLTLQPLPFKYGDATELFSELEKRKAHTETPTLRFVHKNISGETEKLTISFYTITTEKERIRFTNILQVKNETTKQTLMKVSNTGVIIPERGAKEIVPVIQLFIRFSKNPRKLLVNYGFETGECGVCGRKLTDPTSIKYGIGPTCANSLGYRLEHRQYKLNTDLNLKNNFIGEQILIGLN